MSTEPNFVKATTSKLGPLSLGHGRKMTSFDAANLIERLLERTQRTHSVVVSIREERPCLNDESCML